METQCTPARLEYHALGMREVVGTFDGGDITSDAGGLELLNRFRGYGACPRNQAKFELNSWIHMGYNHFPVVFVFAY